MKRLMFMAILLIWAMVPGGPILAQQQPQKGKDGVWVQRYDMKGIDKKFYYTVDTVAQVCFAFLRLGTGAGLTEINCSDLKKRPEWNRIIIWD